MTAPRIDLVFRSGDGHCSSFGGGHVIEVAAGPAERAARRAAHGELVRYPIGHFDACVGDAFETAAADQVSFLARHVGITPG